MNLRIAYFINSFEGGGAASPLPDIARALMAAGAQIKIFALTRRNGHAQAAVENAGIEFAVRGGGERDHLAALIWMQEQVKAWGATHIWTSLTRATLLGQIAGSRSGLPVISWQHNAFLKPWNERLLRLMQRRAFLWVADSHQVAELTARRLNVEADRLVTWPIFFADPAAPQARPYQAGQKLRIGTLGRLHPAKGYDVLIEALAILQRRGFQPPVEWEIDIAGEGALAQQLELQAQQAGIGNIRFSGFARDPGAYLAGLHLYLQPSRREGFCIAAHEACQAGLPVIVSAVGEMPMTVLDGKMGRVVSPINPEALADALQDVTRKPDQLAQMGAAARQRVLERFSKEKFEAVAADIISRLST